MKLKIRFINIALSLLLFCVGFLSVSNTVYAYTAENNFYPINSSKGSLYLSDSSNTSLFFQTVDLNPIDNCYYFTNGIISNISHMIWEPQPSNDVFTFPYLPEKYDYYLLGTVVSYTTNLSDTTFKPTEVYVSALDVLTNSKFAYPKSDLEIYNIDNNIYKGFGFSEKVDFSSKNNLGISSVYMGFDKDGSGNKPANLILEFGIMAIEKGIDQNSINQQILSKLSEMQDSITSSIGSAADEVVGSIDSASNSINSKLEESFDSLTSNLTDWFDDVFNGYAGSGTDQASDNFDSSAGELHTTETQLTDITNSSVTNYTDFAFNTNVLTTLGASLVYVVTWFTNFWDIGGLYTAVLNIGLALFIAFFILRLRGDP